RQQQTLEIEIAKDLPLVKADPSYLERILAELLNNACKYTASHETITVSAFVNPPTEVNTTIWIQVSNSGVEIPEHERDRIFERFYRIPSHDPWRHGGTGLGLALVKKLVERLGATIQVTSENNKTVFTIILPISPP
ncbi:MAG: sensor histidine kinase, partial [Oculatellaceae cyanobacterium bins.114]|nr:sensor histidine kinase [Oculatellaceae cyanobacterium bins.114]